MRNQRFLPNARAFHAWWGRELVSGWASDASVGNCRALVNLVELRAILTVAVEMSRRATTGGPHVVLDCNRHGIDQAVKLNPLWLQCKVVEHPWV